MRFSLSVHARVALLAILTMAAALWITQYSINAVIEGVVADNADGKLDTQIRILETLIDADGHVRSDSLRAFPELDHPTEGSAWRVDTRQGHWGAGADPGPIDFPVPRVHPVDGIFSGRGYPPDILRIHVRRRISGAGGNQTSVTVVMPGIVITRESDRIRSRVTRSLALVLPFLVLATIVLLHWGLGPLRRLREDVAKVRSGQSAVLPLNQPPEFQALSSEVNALIARNIAVLEAARRNASNLTHAIRTPLASLSLQLEHDGASQEACALLDHISQRVTHHLRRARSAAIGLGSRASVEVDEVVTMLRTTMLLMVHGKALDIRKLVPASCVVSLDAEDLTEMLGNLMQNATRYASSRIEVSAREAGDGWLILVEDDGPGIPDHRLGVVLQAGMRLDEATEGYGLGLSIVQELAELYGGRLTLARSASLGGLCAMLDLPK